MPEHNLLTGASLHEPKGIETAIVGQGYVADGTGSGTWQAIGGSVFGEMRVLYNTTGQAITAATDATLETDSDYVKVDTGIWSSGPVCPCGNVTFDSSGYLEVGVAGLYELSFWTSAQISVLNTLLGVRFSTDDTNANLSLRKFARLSGAADDVGSIAGSVFAVLEVGDKVSLWAAVSKSATLTVINGGVTLVLLNEGYTAP